MSTESFDPEAPQKRIATTPSGRQVWVEIRGVDRRAIIDRLPGRWPEIVKARERGVPFDELAKRVSVSPEDFREALNRAYGIIETALHDLAQLRAKMMV